MYRSAGQPGGGGGNSGGQGSAGSSGGQGQSKPDGDVIDAEYVDGEDKK
jgi:hypothetical protein